jgi:type IV pilus assembly protein PilO
MDMDFNSFDDIPIPLRVGFIGVACALLFYFAYMFDFSGQLRIIKSNQNLENDLKGSLQAQTSARNNLQKNISDYPHLFATLIEWQLQLIKPEQLPDLLNEILKIGTANSLQFDLFNPGEKIKADLYYKVPIKIVAEGSYNQLADFISQIANMKWLIAVDNFIIAKKVVTQENKTDVAAVNNNSLVSEINLEAYYRAGK